MKIFLNKIPKSLEPDKDMIAACLKAFDETQHFQEVYLFGSFARGDSKSDSDIDLCIVSNQAEKQLESSSLYRRAIRAIRPKPSFTLVPISPKRLAEKKECKDHFFTTILKEGILIAKED